MLAHRGKAFFARAHFGVGLPPHSRLPVNTSKFMVREHLSISIFTFMSYIAPQMEDFDQSSSGVGGTGIPLLVTAMSFYHDTMIVSLYCFVY